MNLLRLIGDVHGLFQEYKPIIESCEHPSIQVGDFGVGFGSRNHPIVNPKDRYIRGNHDNPGICKSDTNWIPDGSMLTYAGSLHSLGEEQYEVSTTKIFFCGGAHSIDRAYRIEGLSWWPDEQVSYYDFYNKIIPSYEEFKPDIMVTHECPDSISGMLFRKYPEQPPITRVALDAMLKIHKPKIWIFGHWHTSIDRVIEDVRYICLNELEYADLDIDTLEVVERKYGFEIND